MTARVLIAGCGYTGMSLAQQLTAGGHEVWGVRRDAARLPPSIRGIAADLSDRSTLENLPDGLTHVVYAVSPGSREPSAYEDAYVRGLENLIEALAARGAQLSRLSFVSSTSVLPQTDGSLVDERSEARATSAGTRALLAGEALARSAPFPAVIVRPSGIYGPGRTRLLEQVRRGEARLPRQPRMTNRIHRDDLAAALAHLAFADDPEPLYLATDDEPADLADVVRWLARELDAPEPPLEPPGSAPARRTHKRCTNALLRTIGWAPRYPTFRQGYRPLLDTLRHGG